MAKEEIKIVHTAGPYVVREWVKYSCTPCRTGWNDGTLTLPANGGPKCTHGRGSWEVGAIGVRGGWRSASPMYPSLLAAQVVADALAVAASMPAQGNP